jgi:hypothetical protein
MADKLVTIAQFTDSAQASLAKQLLADFGIESVLTGENASNIYSIPAIEGPELQVLESRAKEALKILESNKKQEP